MATKEQLKELFRTRRDTCERCPHVKKKSLTLGGIAWYCVKTGCTVPQITERVGFDWETRFTRVPEWCPLSDSEVIKREGKTTIQYQQAMA